MSIIVSVDELSNRLYHGSRTTLLACTWVAGEDATQKKFHSEHIPTALSCDPATQLAAVNSSKLGRNPLPDKAILQRAFNCWGLQDNHEVVVYDQGKGIYAARAWWILTWAGVSNVKILDGGLDAWEAAGGDTVGGPGNLHNNCTLTPEPGQLPVATIDDVKAGNKLLIDTREANRYQGRKEHLDLKAGHIPGAVNLPSRELLNEDNTYKTPEQIRTAFESVGVTDPRDVIIYSGSGIHSCQAVAAMHHAGLPGAAIYMGGWSQWCADPNNPVQHGA